MKKNIVEFVLINNHFHDNDMFAKFNGKLFNDWFSLANEMGAEYIDLGSGCWENVTFLYNGEVLDREEAFDMM